MWRRTFVTAKICPILFTCMRIYTYIHIHIHIYIYIYIYVYALSYARIS